MHSRFLPKSLPQFGKNHLPTIDISLIAQTETMVYFFFKLGTSKLV